MAFAKVSTLPWRTMSVTECSTSKGNKRRQREAWAGKLGHLMKCTLPGDRTLGCITDRNKGPDISWYS